MIHRLLKFTQIIECGNNPAVICDTCLKDLLHADRLRKSCLKADNFFRSTIPKEFFNRELAGQFEDSEISDFLLDARSKVKVDFNEKSHSVALSPEPDSVEVNLEFEPKFVPSLKPKEVWKNPKPLRRETSEQLSNGTFVCSICLKIFNNLKNYTLHQYRWHNKK